MKLIVESDYNEYLKRKKQGDNVIMHYEQLGYNLCPALLCDFAIMHIVHESIELYQYRVKSDGTFQIEVPRLFEHKIGDVLTAERMSDKKTQKWWNMVFFLRSDENVHYDPRYDSFPISNYENLTFGELISQLNQAIDACEIPNQVIILDGEWAEYNVLRYIISQKNDKHNVRMIKSYSGNTIQSSFVVNPFITKKYSLPVWATGCEGSAFNLIDLYQHPIYVHIPLDENVLNKEVVESYHWKDLLPDNHTDYYLVNPSQGIKILILSANYDAFGNIFLTASNTKGQQKTLLI